MAVKIEMDFYKDFVQIATDELSSNGYVLHPNDNADEILAKYFNILGRAIEPKPRKVLQAKTLSVPSDLQAGFNLLCTKLQNGDDVYSHLSLEIENAEYNDMLLNDWGIYHLHLGTKPHPKNPKFIERTGPVLFAKITDRAAYLIAVLQHGKGFETVWAEKNLLKILKGNWPTLLEPYRIPDIRNLSPQISEEDRIKYRNEGITTFIELDEGFILRPPGGGYMSLGLTKPDGTRSKGAISLKARRSVNHYFYKMHSLEEWLRGQLLNIEAYLKFHNIQVSDTLTFRLAVDGERFWAVADDIGLNIAMEYIKAPIK